MAYACYHQLQIWVKCVMLLMMRASPFLEWIHNWGFCMLFIFILSFLSGMWPMFDTDLWILATKPLITCVNEDHYQLGAVGEWGQNGPEVQKDTGSVTSLPNDNLRIQKNIMPILRQPCSERVATDGPAALFSNDWILLCAPELCILHGIMNHS